MAEAVGLAASIVTLVGTAAYIHQKLNDYRKGAQERRQLLSSIASLKAVLDDLNASYESRKTVGMSDGWYEIVKPLQTHGIFQRIDDCFSEIRLKLEPKHTLNKFIAQVSWPFVKEDVDRNIRQMHDLAASVSFVLQDVTLKLAIITHSRVKDLDVRDRRKEQLLILDWLSSMRFIQQQELEAQKATVGTCDWFLLSEPYVAWKNKENRILYCKAIGGAGKTILASQAYDDVRLSTAGEKAGVFIVYCKHDRPDTHATDQIAGALLRQSLQLQDGVIDTELQSFLDTYYYQEKARPKLEHYRDQLKKSLKDFSSLYVIVDGLDEIKTDALRLAMIKFIAQLREDVNVMFTSRPLNAIDAAFIDTPPTINDQNEKSRVCDDCNDPIKNMHEVCKLCGAQLCSKCSHTSTSCGNEGKTHDVHIRLCAAVLDVSARTPAIRTYVRVRIEQSIHLRKWIQRRPGLSRQIEDRVAEVAQKMFLLARLHMDAIANPDLLRESDFDDALDNLPTELDASYENAMDRVDHYGRMLLQIITCAQRSLSTPEIEHVVGIDPVRGILRDGDIIPATALVSRCAGLVTIDAKGNLVFAHYSIADFFERNEDKLFPHGHADLSTRCLAYLELPVFSKGAELSKNEASAYASRLSNFPFYDYAVLYWAKHVQSNGDQNLYKRAFTLVKNESYLASIVQALWYSTDPTAAAWRKRSDASALELAIFLNFKWLFEELLRHNGADWRLNKLQVTPLMLAAQAGNIDLTRRVLRIPSAINAKNAENETALHMAITNWHEEVAMLLVDQPDIDVNILTGLGAQVKTPLMHAVNYGHIELFKKLLTVPSIDVNISVQRGLTALHWTIYRENEAALSALIAHGQVDLHNTARSPYIPLHEAAEEGLTDMVRILLDAGVDVNMRDDNANGTALMRAADYGHVTAMQLLVERGVDWDARDKFDRHALHSAAINHNAAAAEYLLKATKINVNLQDVHGVTPLHDAAGVKESETVEVLLKYGARVDLANKQGNTPLDVARRVIGATKNVELLSGNTDTPPERKKLETLIDAAEFGDQEEVEAVLETLTEPVARETALKEVDVWLGRAPLHHVIQKGFTDLVPALCDAGADIDAQDNYGRTPLHIAALLGRTSTARVLLERGANVDVKDIWGVKQLASATSRRWGWTAVLLIQFNCPIETDTDLQWLLIHASWQGNLIATKRLVEAGARVDQKTTTGMSPFEYAKQEGHKELAEYLDNVGREAPTPTVRFQPQIPMSDEDVSDQAPPDIETTEDGKIKRLKRTGTDEIRMEQGQALLDKENEDEMNKKEKTEGFPSLLERLGSTSLNYRLIALACLVMFSILVLMLGVRTDLPLYGGRWLNGFLEPGPAEGSGR